MEIVDSEQHGVTPRDRNELDTDDYGKRTPSKALQLELMPSSTSESKAPPLRTIELELSQLGGFSPARGVLPQVHRFANPMLPSNPYPVVADTEHTAAANAHSQEDTDSAHQSQGAGHPFNPLRKDHSNQISRQPSREQEVSDSSQP